MAAALRRLNGAPLRGRQHARGMWRVVQLIDLMLPVYAANMAAPFSRLFARRFPRAVKPVSERWLGSHKTWLGYVLAIAAASAVALVQAALGWPQAIAREGPWWLLGPACGLAAMLGDSVKSLFKRRLAMAPGARWVPADQLDFAIGGLIALAFFTDLGWRDVAIVLAITFFGTIAVNRLAHLLHIKSTPW